MKNKIVVWVLMAFFAGLLHGCSWEGVETGNPINELTEGAYLFTSDGTVHYSFEMASSGKAIIKKINDDGDIEEEVEADMTIDEENNSFTVSVSFSDGTEVVVYGYLNDDGNVLSIQISVNGVTISFDICLYTSENSNVITIKACTEQDMGDNMGVAGEDEQSDSGSASGGDSYSETDVYWVSASEGSDDNPGTIDEPFQTITKALETSQNEETYKDIHVVAGDYEETDEITIMSGIGIYGGYGGLTSENTRERDVENNKTNLQIGETSRCGIFIGEPTYGDIATIDGLYITAPGRTICVYDASADISNNEVHATQSFGAWTSFIEAIDVGSSNENATIYVNIENNVITVDDIWVETSGTYSKGIGFYTEGSGTSGSLNLKDNEITVGDGRKDSWGVIVSELGASSAYFVATGNTIRTGTAGETSSPILLSSLSGESEYIVGGTAIIEGNILIAGDIDQSVKTEYLQFGANTTGIQAWGFGEASHVTNNMKPLKN